MRGREIELTEAELAPLDDGFQRAPHDTWCEDCGRLVGAGDPAAVEPDGTVRCEQHIPT